MGWIANYRLLKVSLAVEGGKDNLRHIRRLYENVHNTPKDVQCLIVRLSLFRIVENGLYCEGSNVLHHVHVSTG
eukprot:XP_001704568.1 Hypothetical protein GL50803_37242 [Giardia lamblia ATCC 50803]